MDHREYIRRCPDSSKAALLIHGIVGTPRHFDRFLDAIPADWSVYNILLDGHGGTVKDFGETSMDAWKKQVDDWLDKLCREYETVVIIAHSMGTLLSLEAASRYPKVRQMILFNIPLIPRITGEMAVRSMKYAFDRIDQNDPLERAVFEAAGVTADKHLWRYLGWIPRYLELFKLCKKIRRDIQNTAVPCWVFQSTKDELVSPRTNLYLKNNASICYTELTDSTHFYYPETDARMIKNCIHNILSQ